MLKYIARRVLWIFPVLIAVSLITFILMHLVPGGPWDREKALAPAVIENLNRRYNLDKPVWEQYLFFVWNAAHGDLGVSYTSQDRSVTSIIMEGFPITATLGLAALGVAIGIGLPFGIAASLRQNSWIDYICLVFATTGASTPNFVLAIVLIIVLAVVLHLLPTSGWGSPEQIIMPAIALGYGPAALVARLTRASMLEVIRQDYVRTARAKGLMEEAILFGHILKNALIPVVTILGPLAAYFITGSFIIETMFSVPGIGRMFVQGIGARDYALILGATLFYSFIVALANLAVDFIYGFLDPRIRYT
ncbi:MAG: ABC transporter permease [Chloroflexi bacterium]|nr:ABC transporter permease [Chloroflexota bacterium]MCL5075324.1 ABC transporter permease [Chloroflexota bacterium]